MPKYKVAKKRDVFRRSLAKDMVKEIDRKIYKTLLKDKKYKLHDYRIGMLADDIGVSERIVALAIAQCHDMHYHDLLNKMRAEEAIAIMKRQREEGISMSDVALLAGFGTRMSMYKTFYKFYGMTPKEYKAKHIEGISEPVVDDNKDFHCQDEHFADIQMLRFRLGGFDALTQRQKIYIYWLAQAALAGRDITFDQHGKYNILIRKTLETILLHYSGDRRKRDFKKLEIYLKRVWFANGIYHHYSNEKFAPDFSKEFFKQALEDVDSKLVAFVGMNADAVYDTLSDVMFDSNVLPKLVNQSDGDDVVKTSAVNYYENVTQEEVERFYGRKRRRDGKISWGLNSKLIKDDNGIKEEVWKSKGTYGKAIDVIVSYLRKAMPYADSSKQKEVISSLIDYYLTGNLKKFDDYSIKWVNEQSGAVDFINGFIEVYDDPLGMKGTWEGLVEYVDNEATKRTATISDNAQWFEDNSPVDKRFKRNKVKGVVSRVIRAAMLGGDEYPASAIGINLPNANWIREKYGSKSITISNLTEAYSNAARGNGFYEEFVIDKDTLEMIKKYGDRCDDLHTDLHECVGHGSGRMLKGISQEMLKTYGNTIEEARADLFGLYYIADEKLVELGLLPDKDAYKAHYYSYLMNGCLTQLVRLKDGEEIEEAHMRNRALIARWVIDNCDGAAEIVKVSDKSFLQINDYNKLRTCFAILLAEIQRIKSEGDYIAARNIVEEYGVKVDKKLHKEMRMRYKKLHIAPYKGFINPTLVPLYNGRGDVVDVKVKYCESYSEQMLRYSKEFGLL